MDERGMGDPVGDLPPEPPECPSEDIDAQLDRIEAQVRVLSVAAQNLLLAVATADDAIAHVRALIF